MGEAHSTPPDCENSPVTFATVFDQEVHRIKQARRSRQVPQDRTRDTLIGLAFSGGGIRSATFNLGFLQAMARGRLLHKYDYLSTVSGGGYIGGWLTAVTQRFLKAQPDKKFDDVEASLIPEEYKPDLRRERSFLHWLRMYSNYLTPNTGLVSGDTWAMVGTWMRNAFLNLAVLALFFLGVFACLQGLLLLLAKSSGHALTLLICGGILLFVAAVSVALNVGDKAAFSEEVDKPMSWFKRNKVASTVMLPYLIACILLNAGLWHWKGLGQSHLWIWLIAGAGFYFLDWVAVVLVSRRRQRQQREATPSQPPVSEVSLPALLIASAIAGLVGGGLLWVYVFLLPRLRSCAATPGCEAVNWMVVTFGPGVVMLSLLAVGIVRLGILGRGCSDLVRELWARLGGYMMLVTLGWLGMAGVCAFGPLLVRWSVFKFHTWSITPVLLWIVNNWVGVKAAKSAKTSGKKARAKLSKDAKLGTADDKLGIVSRLLQSPKLLDGIAKVAPYVFAAGLLLLLSTVIHIGAGWKFDRPDTMELWRSNRSWSACCGPVVTPIPSASPDWDTLCRLYWNAQDCGHWGCLLIAGLVLGAAAFGLSWCVDVNEFSLHHFYRNRLVRCYLGASNPERKPQAFTGFDPKDDIDLRDVREGYPGPYPILNAALNITTGEELGYATRRAKSFIFTPLYCGYEKNAPGEGASRFLRDNSRKETFAKTYSRTNLGRIEKSLTKVEIEGGISLGTAMAISGAAASPNMGSYTSAATCLFMTLFDVRLGWWMGNPRYEKYWNSCGPRLGLGYLFSELVAQSDQQKGYVYLSDGGHFENLAVYELLRRHCKVIVACDVDADPDYRFENLLGLIEKARCDFGADIVVQFEKIRPAERTRESETNYAVGDIYYDPQNRRDKGKFIYVKASMPMRHDPKEKEHISKHQELLPDDVWSYYDQHKTFPHESTADQWFDELQFESYRALGYFIGRKAADGIREHIDGVLA